MSPWQTPSVSTEELNTTFFASGYGADGAAIQNALDEASNVNRLATVTVDPLDSQAPYVVNNAPLEVYDDTVVVIAEDVKLGDNQDHNLFETEGGHGTNPTVRNNVHFVGDGGELNGNRSNNTDSINPGGFYANCINIMATNSSVRNVQTKDPVWHGVNIHGHSRGVVVANCTVDTPGGGIQAHWHEADDTIWSNVKIVNNTINGAHANGNGIQISGGVDCICTGNTIEDHNQAGINVYSGDDNLGLKHCTVASNSIINPGDNGVLVRTHPASGYGVGVSDVSIHGNTITDPSGSPGILVTPGAILIKEIAISNNTVRNGDRGVMLSDQNTGGGPGTEHIIIQGNVVEGSGLVGIQVAYSSNNRTVLSGNSVRNTGNNAIQLSGQRGQCVGNSVDNSNSSGIGAGAQDWAIVGNSIYDCSNEGIKLDQSDLVVVANRCFNNDTGINISVGGEHLILGNNVSNNSTNAMSGSPPSSTIRRDNIGYLTANFGESNFSGNGSTSSYTIAHGLDTTPNSVTLTQKAVTSAGEDIADYDANATSITVNFTTNLSSGETATVGWNADAF